MVTKALSYARQYFSHTLVAFVTLGFFFSVYTVFAVNYVTPGATLDPAVDFPVLCADPLNDCTTEVLRVGNTVGGATSGSILFVDAAGELSEENTELFWDETNNRLGIGTASPAFTLDLERATAVPATIDPAVFLGGALDDMTSSGTYTGLTTNSFFIIIDSTGTPDTFMWFDNNAEYAGAVAVPITGGPQLLAAGVSVTFGSTTGHGGGETWQVDVAPATTTYAGDLNLGAGLYIQGNLFLHTTGTENSFFGAGAGNLGMTGLGGNVGIGNGVMATATNAARNTAIGAYAGSNITSGSFNTLLGYGSGGAIQTGSQNIVIGSNTGTSMIGASNVILIGDSIDNATDTSNYLSLGDVLYGNLSTDNIGIGDSTPDFRLDVEQTTDGVVATFTDNDNNCTIDPDIVGGISCTSDARRKENVVTLDSALPDIRKLRTVSYDFIGDEDSSSIGFIAQEVEDIYPSLIVKNPNGYLTLSYAGLTPMLTRAIQELDIQITDISNLTGEAGMNLVDRLRNWLADAANGIEQIFTKRITTEELCVEDVCVTRDQFLQLLENADITTLTDGETPDPTGDNTPEENIETGDGDVETLTTDGGPIEEEPLPDSELIEEPVDETEEPTAPEPPLDELTFDTEPTEPAL